MFQTNQTRYEDESKVCCDCGRDFWLEAGEQAFFTSKNMPFPKRCKPCRAARKQTINIAKGGN